MDASSLIILVGVATLLIDRLFNWADHVRKSKCYCSEIEMQENVSHHQSDNDKS